MFGFSVTKLIIIGALILAAVAYVTVLHVKINYYKAEAIKYETAYNHLVDSQKAEAAIVKAKTGAQDKIRAEQSAASAKEIFRLQNQHLKDIHALKDANLAISDAARRVFNSTPESGPDAKSPTGQTNARDAKDSSAVDNVLDHGSATLADLLVANETNKTNYLSCREAVKSWQQLWKETEENLNGPSRSP